MNNPPERINPFLVAKRESGIHVVLQVHDVQALRPAWNEEQANGFLARHRAALAHVMLVAGTQALQELLKVNHDA